MAEIPRKSLELGERLLRQRDQNLIPELRSQGITDSEVLQALGRVPRHRLVPLEQLPHSYENRPLPIGDDQTISQPFIVALTSQWAIEGLCQRRRVLEIGTGSGYQAAVLAELFEEVFSIEVRAELAARAKTGLRECGLEERRLHLAVGDGYAGWPDAAPFDAIVLTAAPEVLPPPLATQVCRGGNVVAPVGRDPQLLRHWKRVDSEGAPHLTVERELPVRFVPMIGRAQQA